MAHSFYMALLIRRLFFALSIFHSLSLDALTLLLFLILFIYVNNYNILAYIKSILSKEEMCETHPYNVSYKINKAWDARAKSSIKNYMHLRTKSWSLFDAATCHHLQHTRNRPRMPGREKAPYLMHRAEKTPSYVVWWRLFLLLLITFASTCLPYSRNLVI